MTTPTAAAPSPFVENWAGKDWTAVQGAFRMDAPQPHEVLVACYDSESCEGCAHVLYRNGTSYFYVKGSHCSCFGLEEQWDPEEYTLETLVSMLERSSGGIHGFCGRNGHALLPTLHRRLKRHAARVRRQEREKAAA